MSYLDKTKKSKKKDKSIEHVSMSQVGSKSRSSMASANQFSGGKSMMSRRKGER